MGEFDDSILWKKFKEANELCVELDKILPRYSVVAQFRITTARSKLYR